MQTDTVKLSAKYDCYAISVPPGEYAGFFLFRKGKHTFTQGLFLRCCGMLVLRDGPGTAHFRTPLKYVPVGDPLAHRFSNFIRYRLRIGRDWRIDLKFMEGPTSLCEEGKPVDFLKWSDFPGEIEIGFSFVEG